MHNIGLVLEGGGMRGVYTAGVLDFFMDKQIYFPYVIGVSAGACNAASYVARQRGRNRVVTIDFIKDPRYLSYRNLWKERSMFGMDFIFREIPTNIIPFDFETFSTTPEHFLVGTTDAVSGEPLYYDKLDGHDMMQVIRASSSLPFIAKPVRIQDKVLFDGGIADPIPVEKAKRDGFARNVLVLTRNKDYRKKPMRHEWFARRVYPEYRGLVDSMKRRCEIYNDTLASIERMERDGSVFVIRPEGPLDVGRLEKDARKLHALYERGYQDTEKAYERMMEWRS